MRQLVHSKGDWVSKCTTQESPARFHIRLYQACEAESGYCMGFRNIHRQQK